MKKLSIIFLFIFSLFFYEISAQEVKNQSFSEQISNQFDELVLLLQKGLFYEIPIYTGKPEVSENKVINFEELVYQIQKNEGKIYKYFYDKIIEDKVAREFLDAYQYKTTPSDELINEICLQFSLDKNEVIANDYLWVRYLKTPLPIERARIAIDVMPTYLKKEIIQFKGEVTEILDEYLNKKLGNFENINKKKQTLYELQLQIKLLSKVKTADKALVIKLQEFEWIKPVSSEFKKILVGIINQTVFDENFEIYFPELLKQHKNLKHLGPTDIRNFLASERVVLSHQICVPLIVLVLALGGIIFTLLYKFVNVTGLYHGFEVICGRFSNPDDKGEISHFQTFSFALAATVGLGNIAGIATAICLGGPGIIFWMWVTAFFGMSTKFNSCMFAAVYREIDQTTGKTKGGPMYYLSKGIADLYPAIGFVGKIFAIVFCIFCILASFGGGNLFQVNQIYESLSTTLHLEGENWKWSIGFILALAMSIITFGSVKKIGVFTSKFTPFMCVFYVATCLIILISNFTALPKTILEIFSSAFNFKSAAWGGLLYIILNGVRRATFSNEAGLGTSAIIHASTKTDEPVREGLAAMMEPFADTLIICTLTALVILVTRAHLSDVGAGVMVISVAFASVHPIFLFLLCFAILLFGFSSLLTWSFCGERSAEYLFGKRGILYYRILFIACIFVGPMVTLTSIIQFADIMMLCMAVPNIIGGILLYKKGRVLFKDYKNRLANHEILKRQSLNNTY